MSRSDVLSMAKTCALIARGFVGMPELLRKLFKIVQFCSFWCIFGSDFMLKKCFKLQFFYIKYKYSSYT